MEDVEGSTAPKRLGTYRVERPLGRGGMGEVYLAWDERLRRHVALKRIRGDREDDKLRARFRREAQAIARLNHPAVVQIFAVLRTEDGDCLVLEHVEGETLEARLTAGPLAVAEALALARDVAEGLAEAHDKGIVHRDLKAANVLVAAHGRAKIFDFGVALALGEAGGARAGGVAGTPYAMSPEQAAGRPVDHRSDLFALGGLLYHMLAGRPPFASDGTRGALERVLQDEPPALRDLRPEVPAAVAALILRLLAKAPIQRPGDTREVAAELGRLAAGEPAAFPRGGTGGALAAGPEPAPAAPAPPVDEQSTIYPSDAGPRLPSGETAGDGEMRVLAAHGGGDPVAGDLVARFRGATGVLEPPGIAVFHRPGDAVGYALACHQSPGPRAGLAVLLAEIATGGRLPEAVAARARRLRELAVAGQILLGREVFDLARHAAVAGPLASPRLRWLNHGSFACAGLDDPLEICEVGVEGRAPLRPPAERTGVRRLPASAVVALGWRPAAGQPVPRRQGWELVDQIGAGGFGEVWLAVDASGEKRAFKFCFEASKVKALKREVTLLRLLEGALGQRDDIARLYSWSFDETPYFLEMEYSDGGNLAEWTAARGEMPIETRLELGVEAADALAAAHSVGVLHKDVKPANVLVRHGDDGEPHAVLTDFGIGLLKDPGDLRDAGFTVLGFTETLTPSTAAGGGTAGYMAPELVAGQPASVRSDVYALGVVLYQLAVGDFSRTPAPGWRREVADEMLRADLAAFIDVDPGRRPRNALEVAQRLRSLEERRVQRREAAAMRRALERSRRLRRRATLFAAMAALVALVVAFFGRRAEDARRQAENVARATTASHLLAGGRVGRGSLLLLEVREPAATPTAVDSLHEALALPVAKLVLRGHSRAVENAVWSPDGRHLVTTSHDGTARVWTAGGDDVAVLRGHTDIVWNAAWSPDGKRLVTAGFDHVARVWDPFTGAPTTVLSGHGAQLRTAFWSPDGQRILTSSEDQTARIWDPRTGDVSVVLDGHREGLYSAVWSPGGDRVATASRDSTAGIWDAETGRLLARLPGHGGEVLAVAWSPDGRRVATGSGDQPSGVWNVEISRRPTTYKGDYAARIWDAETGRLLRRLEGHRDAVTDVAWSPDGRRLLSVSGDFTGAIWDADSGLRIAPLQGHEEAVWDGVWNAAGTRVLTNGDDGTARIWDPETGSEVAVLSDHDGRVWSAAWSAGERRILTASEDGTARLWEVEAGEAIATFEAVGPQATWDTISWSADDRIATVSADGGLRLWEPPDIEPPAVVAGTSVLSSVNWSPAGDRLLIADHRLGQVALRTSNGTLLAVFDAPRVKLTSWSADGGRFSSVSIQVVQVWDLETGKPIFALEAFPTEFTDTALSPDGSRLAVVGPPGASDVRDLATGAVVSRLGGHGGRVETVAWSPDGRRIATGSRDRDARIYDAETGEGLLILGHENWVWNVAWSPGSRRLLTASAGHTAQVWDAQTGALLATFRHDVPKVYTAAWSPDGSRAATAAEDGVVRFWAVPDDQPAYLQARLRARNRSCLEPAVYVDNLGLSAREAERRHRACAACVPAFFERVHGVDLWQWAVYQEAWGVYRACFLDRAGD